MNIFINYPLRLTVPFFFLVVAIVTTITIYNYNIILNIKQIQNSSINLQKRNLIERQGTMEAFLRKDELNEANRQIKIAATNPELLIAFIADEQGKIVLSTKNKHKGKHFKNYLPKQIIEKIDNIIEIGNIQVILSDDGTTIYGIAPITINSKYNLLRPQDKGVYLEVKNISIQIKNSNSKVFQNTIIEVFILLFLLFMLFIVFYILIAKRFNKILFSIENYQENSVISPVVAGKDEIARLGLKISNLFEKIIKSNNELKNYTNQLQNTKDELIKSLSLTEATLEATDNAVLVTDEKGNILRVNTNFIELWDLPQSLIEDSDIEKLKSFMATQLKNENVLIPFLGEKIHQNSTVIFDNVGFKDGRIFEYVSLPMVLNEIKVGRVWNFRNITQKIQAQEALINAKNLALETAKMKSHFLASMSHEIRTPMNGVIGMLRLLLNTDLDSTQKHHALIAQNSANSLLTLINDILDFSKIEAGKLDLEELEFNIRDLLGEFIETMYFKAKENSVTLILDETDVEQSTIIADGGRLRQILTNIVGNAIKFTQDGEVIIKAKLDTNSEKLYIDVSDTGIGIPKEKIEKLFNSFTQVDASTTRKFGGTGLGLAISKKLSELMGGEISVTSTLGQGSTFSFNIAVKIPVNSQKVEPTAKVKDKTVLIVDSNPTLAATFQRQLQHWDVQADYACNFEDAKQFFIEKQFDLLFLDFDLESEEASELIKYLNDNNKLQNLKVVTMTSMDTDNSFSEQHSLNFDAFFTKPITTKNMLHALNLFNRKYNINDEHTQKSITDENTLFTFPDNTNILLVEDNKTNQLVASGILEEFNITTHIAENGIEALEILNNQDIKEQFLLILMDCQMPEMDGYEASSAIREGSAGEKYKNISIIAMTANAMKGDREKCMVAGMDDYITKPIDPDELLKILQKYISKSNVTVQKKTDTSSDEVVWDLNDALKRFNGKDKLLVKIIKAFIDDIEIILEKLHEAIQDEDIKNCQLQNHSIKGASSNISALKLQQISAFLEKEAKNGNLEVQKENFVNIKKAVDELLGELNAYISKRETN